LRQWHFPKLFYCGVTSRFTVIAHFYKPPQIKNLGLLLLHANKSKVILLCSQAETLSLGEKHAGNKLQDPTRKRAEPAIAGACWPVNENDIFSNEPVAVKKDKDDDKGKDRQFDAVILRLVLTWPWCGGQSMLLA